MLQALVTDPEEREAKDDGHTIDDLAAISRIPSRTIRFYQSKGLIAPPTMRGRVAYYGPAHVERLKLIAQLQDRGLRIDAIRDLVQQIDRGDVDVSEWLGLDAEMRAPWADDRPRTMSSDEIFELAGEAKREGLLADLARTKVIARQGDVWLVDSPALLRLALRLEALGIEVDIGIDAAEILRKHFGRASRELAELFLEQAKKGDHARLDALAELRPLALEAVRLLFAREMERVLRELVDSGKTAKLGKKKRR